MTTPALVLALAVAGGPAPGDDLAVAWLRDGRVSMRAGPAAPLRDRTPLGSVWKLFVFAYAVERGVETPAYRCGIPRRAGEEYCCDPGQSIERDAALGRSCGLFFEPKRLGLEASPWREFWRGRTTASGAWVADLARLRPETEVPVADLLHALAAVPPLAREAASRALLPVGLEGYGQGVAPHLGGMLRVKTFSWGHPDRAYGSVGGAAGWLVDGTPIWFAGVGSSRTVLPTHAARMADWLPPPAGKPVDDACVLVDYFSRYPILAVLGGASGAPPRPPRGSAGVNPASPRDQEAPAGPMSGRYRVMFENGQALVLEARGELILARDPPRPRIRGRLGLADYLARVVDREGDPGATEAARALAVVARTWLLQNAPFEGGCFQVEDSTRAQRVSPRPATPAAAQVALFTDGLVLRGETVRYRLEGSEPGSLAWRTAVQQAQTGRRYDQILSAAFPRASLAAVTGEEECRRLPEVQTWLAGRAPRWQRALSAQPGFEAPTETLTVCALGHGNPYVDRSRSRIYLRGLKGREDRLTLAHEYVHLAFPYHPCGLDEGCVERLARTLTEE